MQFTQSGRDDLNRDVVDQERTSGKKATGPLSGLLTVLLVDGDDDLRVYLRRCLMQFGPLFGEVLDASTGPEALSAIGASRVDLLICGAQVSLMNANALFTAIRADESTASMLIVQVAGLDADSEPQGKSILADAVLNSPFNAADFGVCLGRLI